MRLESGFRIAPNWLQIGKMAMMSQFPDMTSLSVIFDDDVFLLSSLVTGQVSCQYRHWFWSYDNFFLSGIDQKSGNRKYPHLSFSQYLEIRVSKEYQF